MHEQPASPLVSSSSAPLFRVFLCGPFRVERWIGTTYEPLSSKAWGGSHDPRRLLKRLLCSGKRQVRRGELLEDLWPEVDPDVSRSYLNDAVYRLRGALCPAKGMKSLLITADDHSSVAVPGQELLWVDADAALAALMQAETAEREGGDVASLVQEAARWLERGQFLEEEEGGWTHGKRATMERTRHGCLLWQARLYQQQGSLRQAEMVLNALLEHDDMDEDALLLLMTNLHLQLRTSEALTLYKQATQALSEDGLCPNARIQDLAASLRHELPAQKPLLQQRIDIPLFQSYTHTAHMLPSASSLLLVEHQESFWLTSSISSLGQLFALGWSMDEVLDALGIVLQAVQVMPINMQRQLPQVNAPLGETSIPTGGGIPISEEERALLCEKLGKSIGDSWRRFHSADAAQSLAVGQFLLLLVQQNHFLLYPTVRSTFYATIYMLLGASHYVLGCYEEAQHALEKSSIASVESANAWLVAQVASWQAYVYEAQGQHSFALQTTDRALQVLSHEEGLENLRLRTRLLALSAEFSANLHDTGAVKKKLAMAEKLVEQLSSPHEEFDQVSWLQHTGTCALYLGHYAQAAQQLQQALDELPSQWKLRAIATALSLIKALIHTKELKKAVEVSEKTLPLITSIQATVFAHKLVEYLQTDLLETFPHERFCHTFVAEVRQQLGV